MEKIEIVVLLEDAVINIPVSVELFNIFIATKTNLF